MEAVISIQKIRKVSELILSMHLAVIELWQKDSGSQSSVRDQGIGSHKIW